MSLSPLRLTDALWAAHLWPREGGWLHLATEVALVASGGAQRELGWRARRSGTGHLAELVEAMGRAAGGDTAGHPASSVLDDALRLVTAGP